MKCLQSFKQGISNYFCCSTWKNAINILKLFRLIVLLQAVGMWSVKKKMKKTYIELFRVALLLLI